MISTKNMQITELQSSYFQKSAVFLYPISGLTKSESTKPVQTFLGWKEQYEMDADKLIALYDNQSADLMTIGTARCLDKILEISNDHSIGIFDLGYFKKDVELFKRGEYSKLSLELKSLIKRYHIPGSPEGIYVNAYLYPEGYHDLFAELLNVDVEIVKNVHELCNKPDLSKEILVVESNLVTISPT